MASVAAEITNGILTRGDDIVIGSISIDSRSIKKGELFVALEGENFDGHKFVPEALKKGACGAVVKKGFNMGKSKNQGLLLEVDDTLKAYQSIAAHNRTKNNARVIAITGSAGKTTTKEMMRSILSAKKVTVVVSEKNFNNHVGVPMTLLKIRENHKIAVLEIGINHINEMDALAAMTNPDIALVTNAGSSHLEFLKNVDTVAHEKMKIADGLKEGGTLIFNFDDLRLLRQSRTRDVKTLTYGFTESADIYCSSYEDISLSKSRMTVKIMGGRTITFNLKINGRHNAYNVLAAISAARALKIPVKDIVKGLESFQATDMRSENILLKNDIVLINDAYNANPDSMEAALTLFKDLKGGKRKFAVLGDMGELGEYAKRAHENVGAIVSKLEFDLVFFYGDEMKQAAKTAGRLGMDKKNICWFNDIDSLFSELYEHIEDGDWIMLKGSRSNKLEIIVERLVDKIGFKDKLTAR
jgi:UDP-N-acetylmuramoyl-tripeptide--D-alanyl-D-alanine ligase